MFITRINTFLYGVSFTFSYLTLLSFVLMVSSCSSILDDPQEKIVVIKNSEVKGPYQTEVMNQPSVVSYPVSEDPLRFINEPVFAFNDNAYRYVFSPLAAGYENIVPSTIDSGISNFFYNLREPLYAINHLFQGNWQGSGESLLRVLINTTLGIAGLFDPANDLMAIKRNKTTFGHTLAAYGVGYGAYIVLPLLGPSDLRDTGSLAFNYFAHPLNFIHDDGAARQLLIVDGLHSQVPVLSKYPEVINKLENKYEFIRNLYMQNLQRDGQEKRKEIFKPDKIPE